MKKHSQKFLYFSLALLILLSFSCTPLRKIKYLQTEKVKQDTFVINKELYRLNKGDNLYVDVTTSNTEFRTYISSGRSEKAAGSTNNNSMYLISYQIDANGYLHIPFIEPIFAFQRTVDEVQEDIKQALSAYITDVTVSLKLVNFSVTILGEVNRPGQHFSTNNHLNLFEAIGLAEDLTVYGNRRKVKIVRLLDSGDMQIHVLDITKANVLQNEFFVLQPNDLVYIEPLPNKPFGLGVFSIGTFFSIITTIVVVLNFIK